MHPNEALIHTFYRSFQQRDGVAMAGCYHPDIHFSDPAFPQLHGAQAGAMWKMLVGSAADLRLEYRDVKADDKTGSAHWEAWYTFSSTGRSVHNIIEARFEFKDGRIIRHSDQFDFKRWSGQALGMMGKVFGGSSFLQKKVQAQAAHKLTQFMHRK